MFIKILLLFIIILNNKRIKRFKNEFIQIAVNCGSTLDYKSIDGFTYLNDIYSNEETQISNWNENNVVVKSKMKYTDEKALYMYERWDSKDFTYKIPLIESNKYTLITQHSENAFEYKNQRVMNIKIGDCLIVNNLDVAGELGRFITKNTYSVFELKNNNIYYKNNICNNSYINNSLQITFVKTKYDNPQVQGIIITKGGLENTDYYKLNKIKRYFDEIYEEENLKEKFEENYQKMYSMRKLKKKIRNDYEEYHEEFDDYIEEDIENTEINKGIIMIIILFIFIIISYYINKKIKIN